MVLSRREFLKDSAVLLAVAGLASGCATTGSFGFKGDDERLEQILDPVNYARLTKNWDLIYGPPVMVDEYYVGRHDFEGHKTKPVGISSPGIDYKVPIGIPVVPAISGGVYSSGFGVGTGGVTFAMEYISIGGDACYSIEYLHLAKVFAKEEFIPGGKKMKGTPFRYLRRNEIVALSGDTGRGPQEWGGVQRPHMHWSLRQKTNYDITKNGFTKKENIDPEKNGLDGGKPIFSDGIRMPEDIPIIKRADLLEGTLAELESRLPVWNNWTGSKSNEHKELAGALSEYCKHLKGAKGMAIVDSKHFQDMRALLKKVTIDDRTFLAGSEPYNFMLGFVAYSMVPPYYNQEVICSMPFIAPSIIAAGLGSRYKKAVYREGEFLSCPKGVCKRVEPPK